MITAIETAETLLDYNGNLRGLLGQHRKKTLSSEDFINAYSQLIARAESQDITYFARFGTFAPKHVRPDYLAGLKSDIAALTETSELQAESDLLRSGKLGASDTQWQLRWHFLMERGVELGIFWNSETKRFK
ncbi:hypothetical protein [Larkinella punicea]|uniref:Uncharacterized protein n=1 Tax=Larkinella punicea TaxID=2315727 RepID=A0A368JL60_9BACT|nr:hypothetical protein [Larkinella punicea]RCR66861.1 hypothetical protein DUE52_25270 [Larkinella punicea]